MPNWRESGTSHFLENTSRRGRSRSRFPADLHGAAAASSASSQRAAAAGRKRVTPTARRSNLTALLVARTSRIFLWVVALCSCLHAAHLSPSRRGAPHRHTSSDRLHLLVSGRAVGHGGGRAMRSSGADVGAGARSAIRRCSPAPSTSFVFIAALTIWTMAFLLALDNLGIEIKPLLTGLRHRRRRRGARRAERTRRSARLMSIALDKPFTMGDSLAIDGFSARSSTSA